MSLDDRDVMAWYARQDLGAEARSRLLDAAEQAGGIHPPRLRWVLLFAAAAAVVGIGLGAWATGSPSSPTLTPQPLAYQDRVEIPDAARWDRPAPPIDLPPGMRRTPIRVADAAALSGFLNPGNYVDVHLTSPGRDGGPAETRTLAQTLFVIDLQQVAEGQISVGLLTTSDEDEALRWAQSQGDLRVSLRNDLDVSVSGIPGVDLDDLRARLVDPWGLTGADGRGGSPLADRGGPPLPPGQAHRTAIQPTSTFAMDVDTASYDLTLAHLLNQDRPDPAQVRVEEFVNALPYDYPRPAQDLFAAEVEVVPSPWTHGWHLARIGLQAEDQPADRRVPLHLTLLVDGSCSMEGPLDLVRQSLGVLVGELVAGDTVAVVRFSDRPEVLLSPTPVGRSETILGALDALKAEGGTWLEGGLSEAYRLAAAQVDQTGIHRVVLCTDGMANIGSTSGEALARGVRQFADEGVALTTLGFGRQGYRDDRMEAFADASDGNYAYIDSMNQARRVLVDKLMETMVVLARDAKAQITFDEGAVVGWRQIGYDDRQLSTEAFRDDAVDAGEIGPGHQVTILYEVLLRHPSWRGDHLGTLRIRSEPPGAEGAAAIEQHLDLPSAVRSGLAEASANTRIAIAAASLALFLKQSPISTMTPDHIVALARRGQRPEYPQDRVLIDGAARAAEVAPAKRCFEFSRIDAHGFRQVLLADEHGVPCP